MNDRSEKRAWERQRGGEGEQVRDGADTSFVIKWKKSLYKVAPEPTMWQRMTKSNQQIILHFLACLSYSSCEIWTDELRNTNEKDDTTISWWICSLDTSIEKLFTWSDIVVVVIIVFVVRRRHHHQFLRLHLWSFSLYIFVGALIHSTLHLNHSPRPFQFDARNKLLHLFTSTQNVCRTHLHFFFCLCFLHRFHQSMATNQRYVVQTNWNEWTKKKKIRRHFSINIE